MKNKKSIIAAILSMILFVYILICIISNNVVFFDMPIIDSIYGMRNNLLTSVSKLLTLFGEAKIIIILVVAVAAYLYFIKKDKYNGLLFFFNIVNIAILNQGIKRLVRRDRPVFSQLVNEDGYSFPSGHAMIAMGVYGLLIYYVNKSKLKKQFKILFTILLSLLIVLIGLSRIYLGVHYPSDIIGGFSITLAYLILFIILFNKFVKKNKH